MSKTRDNRAGNRNAGNSIVPLVLMIAGIFVVLVGGAIIGQQAGWFGGSTTVGPTGSVGGSSAASALPAVTIVAGDKHYAEPANSDGATRAWGPVDAPIKVYEFVDYQCPACGQFNKSYEPAVIEAFAKTGKVRWEIKSLTFLNSRGTGQESTLGAHGTFCAAEQGKFWQFHNALFANQFGEGRGAFALPRLKDMAGKLGMDGNAFEACMVSEKYKDTIVADTALATKFNVNSTPSFVINDGPTLAGARTVNDLKIEFGKLKPDVKFE